MESSKIDRKWSIISLRNDYLGALLMSMCALIPISIWNRYIFLESNLPFLLIVMTIAAFVLRANKLYWNGLLLFLVSFSLFIIYAWARLDMVWGSQLNLLNTLEVKRGIYYVLDLIIFCLLFVIAALLYYKKMKFSVFLWFLICGYIIAFILRNYDIPALQVSYNLSPGFALITLLPFIYLKNSENKTKNPFVANAMFMLCVIWLALIGARTAVATLFLFYLGLRAWPFITRNRFIYYSIFWGMLLGIVILTILYLSFAHLDNAVIEGTVFHIFSKRLGTRTEIWMHLLQLISQNPILGYGTDHATALQTPLTFLEFTYNRNDLSSHSTYFEILYRLGIFGLLGFVLIMFSIWRLFWAGRKQWVVRVAGAFLLSSLFFASTCEFLVFSSMQLRSGFAWVILGIGAGASFRVMSNSHRRYKPVVPEKINNVGIS
ncbi:MAG: O-antigen ligase family protein [Smithellaceae bacterium]